MIDLHPSYIERNGRAEFVVLPMDEYRSLQEYLEDMEDLLDLRKAKDEEAGAETISPDDLKRDIGPA
jgi:PHD/YefM family antitoxin component YafN of YafNO toxin-antitoxin module